MKKYQKTALIEVIGTTSDGDYLVQNEGNDKDRWIIPKATFESTYEEDVHDFGWAFKQVKNGKGVRLPQWQPDVVIRAQYPDEHSKMTAPYLYVESRFGRVPWKETMIELFAENWEVVE